jgi:tetratricopeptide (TPR) repeat protein
MKRGFLLIPLLASWLVILPGLLLAGPDDLPRPRMWQDVNSKKYSKAEFEQLLEKMKAERQGLEGDWQALLKRSAPFRPRYDVDEQLHQQMKELVKLLQEQRPPAKPRELEISNKMIDPLVPGPPAAIDAKPPPKDEIFADSPPETVDSLSQAQALFRAGRFEEALTSFRQVDLKGKKADSRAPVQYLMAICLLHLNQSEEALPLLRDVANSRGDEKLAEYAQWQLEMCRWQREISDRLQDFRKRRLAVEKKL